MAADRFRFLSVEHRLAQPGDWNDPARSRLWLYNAHYFDDLVARDASSRHDWHVRLLERWIAENPPGHGAGWEPYPSSLRIVNWIKWMASTGSPWPQGTQSLATQVRWLRQRLEWHLLGNHLWANAKALVFAGVFFDGPEASAWRKQGLRLLDRELDEQVLADGGHFERSPMYHAIMLEDLLDLVQLGTHHPELLGASRVAYWRQRAGAMQSWLWTMTHPDGDLAFFNDATLDVAPQAQTLRAYAERLGLPAPGPSAVSLQALPATGYVRANAGPAALIADVGEIGPDYLPGHAHADTLSFELSLDGVRLVVNSGISRYDAGPERLAERGTAAHSTVQVAGENSSEVWSSFRVGRRARPMQVEWQLEEAGVRVCAGHDGYRWLPGRHLVHRQWQLSGTGLRVVDTVSGETPQAVCRFHLHPDWVATMDDERQGKLTRAGRSVRWHVDAGRCEIAGSSWHPGFGKSLPSQMLVIIVTGGRVETAFHWD